MLPNRDVTNVLVGLVIFFVTALLCYFITALMHSAQWGEIAGALGNVVGGMVGAAAAVLAVWLTFTRAHVVETRNVTAAIQTEVAARAKYVMWSLDMCVAVKNNIRTIPRKDAMYMVRTLAIKPTIYPSVADRIRLLPRPEATVAFYNWTEEAVAMTESFVRNTSGGVSDVVTKDVLSTLADCLTHALILSQPVISGLAQKDEQFSEGVRQVILQRVGNWIQLSRTEFPPASNE